ncbi:ABC transporter substrate-binding protein [Paenibacillus mendelii]|uniref:ABC transporter substrate-binding protein n=1 Tax=Paenibacillus mendelii TaxID=206163 RepID=A0ABV6J736_9BACL|nr:extracellular solute-binding protein [Paenibacillus mendelii]MCQ6564040.1 extracellular solute-binding protein [Paenibacillus mendelii]
MYRKVISVMLVCVFAVMLAGCGGPNKASSGENDTDSADKVKIVFWNSYFPTVDENNKSKKKEEFYISQAVKRFEESHPGITVEVQDMPSGNDLFTKFQTSSIAKNGPDLTVLWSGNYMLRAKQYLEKLNPYFNGDEKSRIIGWEATTDGFNSEGDIYGVPAGTDGTFVFYYNKKLFRDAGIDPEASRPKNIDEFFAMLDKLKAQGTVPLALGKDAFWHIASYWISQTVTPSGLDQLVKGERHFSDPALVRIASKWAEIYEKGYATPLDQGSQMFNQGKAAISPGGHGGIVSLRKVLGDDLGMMKIPDFSNDVAIHDGGVGGVGAAYVVTNYSENKKETVEFIKFILSKEEQIHYIESGEGSLTVTNDIDISQYTKDPYIATMQQWAAEPSTIFWPDNVYPAELTSEISALEPLLFTGKISPEKFMNKIDEKRDEIKSANK